MESIFENEYEFTEELNREFLAHLSYKSPRMAAGGILGGLCLAVLILSFVFPQAVLGDWSLPGKLVLGVIPIAVILLVFLLYKRVAVQSGRREQALKLKFPRKLRIVITFEKIDCICEQANANASALLENVQEFFQTKNLFVIKTVSKEYYILKKDSFTKGDDRRFHAFLVNMVMHRQEKA